MKEAVHLGQLWAGGPGTRRAELPNLRAFQSPRPEATCSVYGNNSTSSGEEFKESSLVACVTWHQLSLAARAALTLCPRYRH